jgi:hypothetical protein
MTHDLDALRAELDDFAQPEEKKQRSPREERIIAGFEDIQRFVAQHGRAPAYGEGKDIFERLYAVRLDRLRRLDECRDLLLPLDHQGLLEAAPAFEADPADAFSDDELLAELRVDAAEDNDLTTLRHVRPRSQVRAADETASREPCKDFDKFKPLFERAERELKAGIRETRRFGRDAAINEGEFFIVGGQFAYVAHMGETIRAPNGEKDARLRVIYSNGTESNLLRRSLQRALYKDEMGRRLTDPDAGPLFGDSLDEGDVETGTIYVLRSRSDHPYVAEHRELIHKVGVTGGKIETRIANAANQATYLLADVEVVATYKLVGIHPVKLENLLHRIFAPAQLDLTIQDRFGRPVRPREWFLVPLHVLEEAVGCVRDGSITDVVYDPATARLVERKAD